MQIREVYICDFCGTQFDNREDCRCHEATEHKNYSVMDDMELSKELTNLSANGIDPSKMSPAFNYESPDNTIILLSKDSFRRLTLEVADRLQQDYNNMLDWISVEDELPKNEEKVLACSKCGVISIALSKYIRDGIYDHIIAWCPLPAPYKS